MINRHTHGVLRKLKAHYIPIKLTDRKISSQWWGMWTWLFADILTVQKNMQVYASKCKRWIDRRTKNDLCLWSVWLYVCVMQIQPLLLWRTINVLLYIAHWRRGEFISINQIHITVQLCFVVFPEVVKVKVRWEFQRLWNYICQSPMT